MCDICRRAVCPSSCPNETEAGAYREEGKYFCGECGMPIPRGTVYYRFSCGMVCASCAERLDIEGILRLVGVRGTYALLDLIGAERRFRE